ncbi:unnamed protein product [Rhizophagus irregularis]|nr:unnamed protein product [Rhizophagus irregularis]
MELAIYYCRGRELKDAIIVAYFLEYYSRNPTNCVGWLCTVSKAIPLLFKYNYDDFARKLFIRCFADQGHLLGQDPDEIIPKEYLESEETGSKLVVEISFSIFLIWIQFILFLRLRSDIGIYIYYVYIPCNHTTKYLDCFYEWCLCNSRN